MIGCLVMGDSIAVGVGQQLPECRVEAKVGISSGRVVQALRSGPAADKVVISLGANDGASGQTMGNLQDLRRSVVARVVVWLLPSGCAQARDAVRAVAARFGDRVIDTAPYAGPDRLHPTGTGYRALAALARQPA